MTKSEYALAFLIFGQFILVSAFRTADAAFLRGLADIADSADLLNDCPPPSIETIVDNSASIGTDAWTNYMIPSLKVLAKAGKDGGIITFSKQTIVQAKLGSSQQELLSAIDKMASKALGGSTYLDPALKELQKQIKDLSADEISRMIGLTLTDGAAFDKDQAKITAKALKDAGLTLGFLGVGSAVDTEYLEDLAGVKDGKAFVYKVEDFKDLVSFIESISKSLCNILPPISLTTKPTGAPSARPSLSPTAAPTDKHDDVFPVAAVAIPAVVAAIIAAIAYKKYNEKPKEAEEVEDIGRTDIAGTKKTTLGYAFTEGTTFATRGMATYTAPKDKTFQHRDDRDAAVIQSELDAARAEEQEKRARGYTENPNRIIGKSEVKTAEHRTPGSVIPQAQETKSFFEVLMQTLSPGDDSPASRERAFKLCCCCCTIILKKVKEQQDLQNKKSTTTPFSSKAASSSTLSVSSGSETTTLEVKGISAFKSSSKKTETKIKEQAVVATKSATTKPIVTKPVETKSAAPVIQRPANVVKAKENPPVVFGSKPAATSNTVVTKPAVKTKSEESVKSQLVASKTVKSSAAPVISNPPNPVLARELGLVSGYVKDRAAAFNKTAPVKDEPKKPSVGPKKPR